MSAADRGPDVGPRSASEASGDPRAPEAAEARAGAPRRHALPTVLAVVVLWAALTMPGLYAAWGVQDFLRMPLAAVVLGVLALLLPRRAMRPVAVTAGLLLAAMVLLKGLNLGFRAALTRPFDIVDDWSYLRDGVETLATSSGPVVAVLATVVAVLVVAGLFVLLPWAALRTTAAVGARRSRAVPVVAVLVVAWAVLAATGVGWPQGYYTAAIADTNTARMAVQEVGVVPADLHDRAVFGRDIRTDPLASVPASRLVAGLAGDDVVLVFVESFGRVGLDDPQLSPTIRAALTASDRELASAGFSARSAWADSPTFGGSSWLAHSSVEAGLWVNSQRRYDQLMATSRLTLSRAFGQAGWRTVFDVPSTDRPWPQGRPFYGYDTLYTAFNVGYRGQPYGYATMPDQYIYKAFAQRELTSGTRRPVYAEIDTLSSHYPWTPPPRLLPWDDVGDGSEFAGPVKTATSPRSTYADAVAYAMRALAQFVVDSHDPHLVVLAVGDHQPNNTVTRPGAGHETPLMLISRDPAVLRAADGWGWNTGLAPASDAPAWKMSVVRNRIFAAFGTGVAP